MTATKDKMKQRSFYMDDETYGLIEKHADKLGASNGTALRMIVRKVLLDEGAAPVSQPSFSPEGQRAFTAEVLAQMDKPAEGIVLPSDKQETFTVPERFKDKGPRAPKPVHSDDDF